MTEQRRARPLSPHVQIYNLPLAARISILHRITGVALSGGILLLILWLAALAGGAGSFNAAHAFFGSWLGLPLLFGFSFALYLHLLHGLRHLLWDFGLGLEKSCAHTSNYWIIALTVLLTLASWLFGFWLARL